AMHIRYNCHIVKHNINNNEIISGYTLSAILAITNKYHILIKISGWKFPSKKQLDDLLDCPLSYEGYLSMLKEKKIITTGTSLR
ncbi:MAG: hypothetical protein V1728_05385, partial [Candidatus Micrarchaeota archaeon]